MGRKKTLSPQQQARKAYFAKHGLRGNGNANIWFTRDTATGKDLLFIGDAKIEHFYFCEGDPVVVKAEYLGAYIGQDGQDSAMAHFDARVTDLAGRLEFRTVGRPSSKRLAAPGLDDLLHVTARSLGGSYRHVSLAELDSQRQRIENWRRALRFLRAASGHPLSSLCSSVRALLEHRHRLTIGDLLLALEEHEAPLVTAACVKLLRARAISSDLDSATLSRRTMLRRGEKV